MEQVSIFLRLWKISRSKRLAALLIFTLAAVSAFGMIVSDTVFQEKWFVALGLVFLINLTACTIQQFINSRRLWKHRAVYIKQEKNTGIPVLFDKETEEKLHYNIGKGYKLVSTASGRSLWVTGSLGIWGSVVFHIAVIIITLGGLASWTIKMEGDIRLAEGEVRYESHEYYHTILEGPFFGENYHKGFGLTLQKQNIVADEQGDVVDIISDIAIIEDGQVVKQVSLGEKEPLVYKYVRIFQKQAGFAPLFEVTGPGNKPLASSYILLETVKSSGETEFRLSGFPVPDSPYTLDISFFPDMVKTGGNVTTNKHTLTNPGAQVAVMMNNKIVTQKVIKQGEAFSFEGFSVKMGEIRHWNSFNIVNDPGADIVFAGSWLALAGLFLLYLLPFKKVQVNADSTGHIEVLGVTNRYRKFFDEELNEIRQKLDRARRMN